MYLPISLKEAIGKINKEWFLPAIQRPYVWGNRYESEKYICKLFDSLFHGYPVGGIILWKADNVSVAHREFLTKYQTGAVYSNVNQYQWSRPKCLVYDGQQRLQTIFSCLMYTFNDRILVFDLKYDPSKDEDIETGFYFVDDKAILPKHVLPLNQLFCCSVDIQAKRTLRINCCDGAIDEEKETIEENFDKLWDVFVKSDSRSSLAYYEITETDEKKVNEIFERLNTGGISLSNTDLLYSRIKALFPDFESEVMAFTKRPTVILDHYDILQLLYIAVIGQSRVSEKVTEQQVKDIVNVWNDIRRPLEEFFDEYIEKHLGITDISIIRSKQPLYIIILFLYYTKMSYAKIPSDQVKLMDKFLITAELNDWTLQSYINHFTKIVKGNNDKSVFPWDKIVSFVHNNGKRNVDIREEIFCAYPWFSLKVLMPNLKYSFLNQKSSHRFNPEIDHIFPRGLKGQPVSFSKDVDILWNLQPVDGDVNNQKRNQHPHSYFTDAVVNGKKLNGSQHFKKYHFCPELTDALWQKPYDFINWRKEQMLKAMEDMYDIKLVQTTNKS